MTNAETSIKKIDFLKSVGSAPGKKITEIAKEFNISRNTAVKYLNEFVINYVLTDSDSDFPNKLMQFYNRDLKNETEWMSKSDIDTLYPFVEEYYNKELPGYEQRTESAQLAQTVNNTEDLTSTMSYTNVPDSSYSQPNVDPQQFLKRDMSSDTGLLKTLLMQAKYVHPTVIDRFLAQYDMNKEFFDKNPMNLLEYMKHIFTNSQGEQIFRIFQSSRGKFVYGADGQAKQAQGMDPQQMMMMMQMMGGGTMNPQLMPFMMNMDSGNMMQMMMMMQMMQKSKVDESREQQNQMFERLTQTMMMKMVSGSMEDKRPMDWMGGGMGGGMGMGMGPPTVTEVYDETGSKVKSRNFTPNWGGMQQQHVDPTMQLILGKTMDANTALLTKMADTGNLPTQILTSLIPFFKDQGNMGMQMSTMIDTMNKIAPGFFDKSKSPEQGGLEIYKLKFDTELAMQSQKMELAKMEHTWRVDEMDRKSASENANNWMTMLGGMGEKLLTNVAPAVVEGFGKGMLNKKGGVAEPQMSPEDMQRMMEMRRRRAAQEAAEQQPIMNDGQRMEQPPQQAYQPQPGQGQGQVDPQTLFIMQNMQQQLQQSEQQRMIMAQQLAEAQNTVSRPGNFQIDEKRLAQMSSGELQQVLQELRNQGSMQQKLGTHIESIIANRQLLDAPTQPSNYQPPQYHNMPAEQKAFETGEGAPEQASSSDTAQMEDNTDTNP